MFNKDMFDRMFTPEFFQREDESEDSEFYKKERIIDHLDAAALDTVEKLVEQLVIEDQPIVLDLMAGWNSHIPETIQPEKVTGLGLNKQELEENKAIDEIIIHDLNKDPKLPFEDNQFDIVINTVSVDYMTKPREVFTEVGRILKPGGLFLVVFSNRMFPQKAIKLWRQSGNQERIMYVDDLFQYSEAFEKTTTFISRGRPRPKDDKYYQEGLPSDPIYAVYAEKKGRPESRKERPKITCLPFGEIIDEQELCRRKEDLGEKLECPHCGEKLKRWQAPPDANITWNEKFLYACFNDECPKFVNGFDVMCSQGNIGYSFRFMYIKDRDACTSMPVYSHKAMREGIVEE